MQFAKNKTECDYMTEITFKKRKLNIEKLLSFGFIHTDGGYVYHTDLVDGQMKLTVKTEADGKIYTKVTDKASGDEYVLHRVAGAVGSFVGGVRTEYEAVLEEISAKCFDAEVFKSEQAKEVIAYVREKYGDELEYLWQKFPDNAIVRRCDNRKWYAAILTVSRKKLGLNSEEMVEILDLRLRPEEMEKTVDNIKYFPGYHMNKKHWITLCLDGTVPTKEIFARIDDSYKLAIKKEKNK